LRLNTVEPAAGFQITHAFVYSGAPFSDAGFEFTVPCIHAGARIMTAAGERAVELLSVGDMVATKSGRFVPIRWVGRRRIDCRRHPRPHDVWPVRVRANAFAPGGPIRDLLLSPDHAIAVANMLIPVRHLINNATVKQECVDAVDYVHVELPRHDVLLAEELPVESYLDTGNRRALLTMRPCVRASGGD
jgi:hypothetical protein